ncbi:MAG: hypothetical protein RIR18_2014, partial [Pseudomonadota bacterium]
IAFGKVRKALVQGRRYRTIKYAVAQKLQALIVWLAETTVRQCRMQKAVILKLDAQSL